MKKMTAPIRWFQRSSYLHNLPNMAMPLQAFNVNDFRPQIRTRILILQPTPFCNISCTYCYLPDRNLKARMSMSVVRRAAERLRDDNLLGSALTVAWHAGEPLTVPPSFYDEAIGVLCEILGPTCNVSHSIQTNATLINSNWCNLFKRHNIHIGVSIDGPPELHNVNRRTRNGQPTHSRVERGIDFLRAHEIPFHVIAVVTAETLNQPDTFYEYFARQGILELGCNFDEAEGLHQNSSLSGKEEHHTKFLTRLLELSTTYSNPLRLRELALAFDLIARPMPTFQWKNQKFPDNAQTIPFALITVKHNGDFSCFSPELLGQSSRYFSDFVLGNVAERSYLDSTTSDRFLLLWNKILKGTYECKGTCAYFNFCGGGAPANKFFENGDLVSTETLYCRTMIKRPLDTVLGWLERK